MLVNGYSNLVVNTPECVPGVLALVANFVLDGDVVHLFPYINAIAENAEYLDNPQFIKFTLDGIGCALYPDNAVASPFPDHDHIVKFIGRLIDYLNDLDSRKDNIEPNFKKHRQIPVLEIFKLLPQSNCLDCGYPSCMAFANDLSSGKTEIANCPDIQNYGDEKTEKLKLLIQ